MGFSISSIGQKIQDQVRGSIPGLNNLQEAANEYQSWNSPWVRRFESIYNITWNNWYRALPYGFRFRSKEGKTTDFYLPINPSNIQITTHFATNVISTLYGTVEEHSESRYVDIVIKGTTGMAPRFWQPLESDGQLDNMGKIKDEKGNLIPNPNYGRQSFEATGGSVNFGGFAQRTASAIENLVKKGVSLGQDLGLIKEVSEVSGINERSSGYSAFHNMYRFLLWYKKDIVKSDGNRTRKTSRGNNHPLRFINYKDSNQYNVAIQTFQLNKDSEDPMLYKYTIIMRGYEVAQADGDVKDFGEVSKADLGLNGVDNSSAFSKMNDVLKKAKSFGYGAKAGIKGIGS